jgi:hypothetical protein
MQAVNNGFQNLETRITEVGRTTVRVGKLRLFHVVPLDVAHYDML